MSLATLSALALGLAFGALAQRTHFCTMGAITDAVLFGSLRRVRSVLMALALAAPLVQALRLAGLPVAVALPPAPAGWAGAALGGLSFGFGMVLAGGCWSRILVRVGTGSLKALVVVLLGGLSAAAVWAGPLAPMLDLVGALAPSPAPPFLPPAAGFAASLIGGIALLLFCVADEGFRNSRREQIVGIGLGLLVPAAWLAAAADPALAGLTFAVPAAEATALLAGGTPAAGLPGAALIVGTVAGSFGAAASAGQLRLETFVVGGDMIRHLIGAVLLGVGGALAAGCTIGLGLSGTAALLPTAFLAAPAMAVGAIWALRYLETGRLGLT
jgi:uncharacterized membrane protein YedE/YeeE